MSERSDFADDRTVDVAGLRGQWRLAWVELANWGSFSGYHRFAVSRRGMLITGDSGSGKSTILDAIAAVMTPPRDLRLNAAASTEGKRGSNRTVLSYIRGAHGAHSTEEGDVRASYLRDRIAVWSGVLLRFEQGGDEKSPLNLVALYFQKANSNDSRDTSTFYATVKGDLALQELEEFGLAGADMTAFNKAFAGRGKATRSHAGFSASFCSQLGIAGPETLTLLHKIQAAKDMGSLDRLFREYMMERPKTFEFADEAVEQFGELEQAYDRVVDQREQMVALEPLPTLVEEYHDAQEEEEKTRQLDGSLERFLEQELLCILEARRKELLEKRDSLTQELQGAKQELSFAQEAYDRANEALTAQNGGSTLASAELARDEARQHLEDVERDRARLSRELIQLARALPANVESDLEPELPDTLTEFELLKRESVQRAEEMREWIADHAEEKTQRYGFLQQLQERREEYESELRHLRSQASNIPRRYHEVRTELVRHLGLATTDLPFCGELIDVVAEEASWRGAIERVLRSFAVTLLVEASYARPVAEYLDRKHLGLRFEYEVVADASSIEVPQRDLSERSLIRKLAVVDVREHPAYTRWVHRCLRERFDYVCVEDASDMASHRKALTRGGQVKNAAHYIKDDRRPLTDASNWRLGSSNETKIADLMEKTRALSEEVAAARDAARDYDENERRANAIIALSERLGEDQWAKYDLQAARARLESAQSFLETLRGDPTLAALEQKRTQARERLDAATDAHNGCAGRLNSAQEKVAEVESGIAERRGRLGEQEERPIDDEALAKLRELFAEAVSDFRASVEKAYDARNKVGEKLRRLIEQQRSRQQESCRQAEKTMQHYKERWPAESADLTTEFVDAQAYVKLYRRIKASGLPEYEGRFLAVLNDFSQDQVTAIASEIRNAYREIRDRLEPVNRSLLLSEFSPGVNLRIEVQEQKSQRVRDFLADLKEIASGSLSGEDVTGAYERYHKTAQVMRKLGASDHASQTWRTQCLDTRSHVRFIAQEVNAEGDVINVHSNDGGLSGGERQKFVLFCLAAALRYQLADDNAPIPTYGTIILDEAFDKSDRTFAKDTLLVFERFGFHMVLVTPNKLIQLLEDHIGAIGLVNRTADQCSHIRVIALEDVVADAETEK